MKQNLFQDIPENIPEEIIETIIESDSIRIERIISKGQISPPNFWYDQDKNECVIVIKGKARLQFEAGSIIKLVEGDFINIPAHQKHRVEWTDPKSETIWLAIFY
ncbi:MAG: cupin domain-containing protein [Ignavibacteria bacterium]|jgi:cupin 2 domain-containing protein